MEIQTKQINTIPSHSRRFPFVKIIRDLAFIVLLVLATSHESANPKLGDTTIDFYTKELTQEFTTVFSAKDFNNNSVSVEDSLINQAVKDIYITNDLLPLWSINFNANDKYEQLKELIGESSYFGLNSLTYQLGTIDSLREQISEYDDDIQNIRHRAEFELKATYSYVLFALNISRGINSLDTSLAVLDDFNYLISSLIEMHKNTDVYQSVKKLQPDVPQYVNLQQALENYIKKVDLTSVPRTITKKSTHKDLYEYFKSYWSLADSLCTDPNFVEKSIIDFQVMHGLRADGKLNRRTLQALNTPKMYRYYQASLNLDRLRKNEINTSHSIFVNIPEYKLHILNNNKIVQQHDVVVGNPKTPTPILESNINKVVANPYWVVPKSIAINEIIPRIKKDSTFLKRNRYEVVDKFLNPVDISAIDWNSVTASNFDYWFRQNKGRGNALGLVKFLFPNDYSVYLHDTPSKSKFKYDIRAYSHGCVRVKNPEELAEYVISNFYAKESDNVKDIIKKKIHKEYELDVEIPVYLKYITCSADEKGNIIFLTDIYKKDGDEIKSLFPDYEQPV